MVEHFQPVDPLSSAAAPVVADEAALVTPLHGVGSVQERNQALKSAELPSTVGQGRFGVEDFPWKIEDAGLPRCVW